MPEKPQHNENSVGESKEETEVVSPSLDIQEEAKAEDVLTKTVDDIYEKNFSITDSDERKYLDPVLDREELSLVWLGRNKAIAGVGWKLRTKLEEIAKYRDKEQDMPIVFECTLDQIAHSSEEVNENTKAYVGSVISKDIFKKIGHLEYIYTKFPGSEVRKKAAAIGGKSNQELLKELRNTVWEHGLETPDSMDNSYGGSQEIIESPDFEEMRDIKKGYFFVLSANQMGLKESRSGKKDGDTVEEACRRAKEAGLQVCSSAMTSYYCIASVKDGRLWGTIPVKEKRETDQGSESMAFHIDGLHGNRFWVRYRDDKLNAYNTPCIFYLDEEDLSKKSEMT